MPGTIWYINTHSKMHTKGQIHVAIYADMQTCTHTCTDTQKHTHMDIHTQTYNLIYMHRHSTHTRTYTPSHIKWYSPHMHPPLRGRGSSGEESTMWMRFVWGGEHHRDEVHLGRRAPRGRGSSGEEREGSRQLSKPQLSKKDLCDSSHLC